MGLTKLEYVDKKLKYTTKASMDEVTQKLGALEAIISKYNLDSEDLNFINLDRSLLLGKAALKRIKLARGHKIYFNSAKKIRKANLVGFADNGLSLDQLEIERNGEIATIPYTRVYISRREARRAKKTVQHYKLNEEQFKKIFGDQPYKKSYLTEIARGSDEFMVYTKVFHAYYRSRLVEPLNIDQLKEKYGIDILVDFKEERQKFFDRAKKYLEYSIYLQKKA